MLRCFIQCSLLLNWLSNQIAQHDSKSNRAFIQHMCNLFVNLRTVNHVATLLLYDTIVERTYLYDTISYCTIYDDTLHVDFLHQQYLSATVHLHYHLYAGVLVGFTCVFYLFASFYMLHVLHKLLHRIQNKANSCPGQVPLENRLQHLWRICVPLRPDLRP